MEKNSIVGYSSKNIKTNFRQLLQIYAKKNGVECQCIRCREVKKKKLEAPALHLQEYESSNGREVFISVDSVDDKTLYGFIRLRLQSQSIFQELNGIALIRELHVYGFLQSTATSTKSKKSQVQHKGFGRVLLMKAENVAYTNGYRKVAVISGVGVRNYYRKFGYELEFNSEYMCKNITLFTYILNFVKLLFFFFRKYSM